MATSGSIVACCLILSVFAWLVAARAGTPAALARIQLCHSRIPVFVWIALGLSAFVVPILEYWITARSHANGLAGYLPWADATEYFFCSETFLLSLPSADHCGKRPFYVAFFADVLWLSGNRMQVALLLQTILVGGACMVLVRVLARDLGSAAALAAHAAMFLYLAAFASGLVITENVGVMIGCLGMAVLWRASSAIMPGAFVVGVAMMGAAVTVRPGPMFILPALLAWYFLCAQKSLQSRVIVVLCAVGLLVAAFSLSAVPALVAGKSLGSTHSNFSYSLYGLVVGGKGWKQVTIDHPEIFNQGLSSKEATDRVYGAAWHSLQTKPHLFLLGYAKGIGVYFKNHFRYANEYKPLRYPLRFGLLIAWVLGVWFALQRWRQSRYALLLWLQGGMLVSAPFIVFDGYSRVYAPTVGVDAAFVALGMAWLARWLTNGGAVALAEDTSNRMTLSLRHSIALAILALLGPVIALPSVH